jgi:endonuclease/exonuclease/phosphatase family metal-dependent hydrolase
MKRIALLIFCTWTGVLAHQAFSQEAVDSSRVLRVLSFNILHGETLRGDFDLEQIARVIRETDPDLVALQEVDLYTGRTSGRDLASELGLLTQMVPLFGRAMPYDGGEYGEGILSRFSFLSSRNHALPAGEGKEPRAALEVRVILDSGDTLAFVGTHFDHTGDVDRINQAARVREILAGVDLPVLLAGDLNATPESRPMEILFSDLQPSDRSFAPTIPSDGPRAKIDYILYGPPERWRVLESRVICDTVASDHCAVLGVLELLPSSQQLPTSNFQP